MEVETPNVGLHEAPLRVLEVALAQEGETEFSAKGIRRRIVDGRKRMQETMLPLCPGRGDRLRDRGSRNSSALEFRNHGPADFVHFLAIPGPFPVDNPADPLARGLVHDLENSARTRGHKGFITRLAFDEFLTALRPAEMHHHPWVAKQLLEKGKVILAPSLYADGRPFRHAPPLLVS